MKIKSIVFLLIVFFSLQASAQDKNSLKLYVGTFTSEGSEGIYQCNFNTETGDLVLENTIKEVDNPSFLSISENRKYLYAVSRTTEEVEKTGGYIIAYKIEKNGGLKLLNKQVSNGFGPCHVDVSKDGKYVAIATYFSGTTSLYPVKNNGKLVAATSTIINKGMSVDKERQTESHAHSIQFSPFDNSVFSADLGTDQFNIYNLENNKLIPAEQPYVKMEFGAGPRHFQIHPNGKIIYVISELNSSISVLQKTEEQWQKVQDISTLPEDFTGKSFCADIHISKDGKYLYGSNRGHNSIAVFSIDKQSSLIDFKGVVSVEGNWPRNFTLSPDGKFMLVANQKSGNITVFKMNKETGFPEYIRKEIMLPAPVCLEFL
jgi:6-phosphogluconolactonase